MLRPFRPGLVLLACLALPIAVIPASAASKNLLANPGFEDRLEGHSWMPAGWDTSISGLPTTFFGCDTFLVHGGKFSANVANVSTVLPMAHNWSQSLQVGKEAWGKDLLFTVWTRSNGVEGRAYCMLQAYRDTISYMAHQWKVPRDEAADRLHIHKVDDPLVDFGWKRVIFTENETDWVKREMRVWCAPGTNMVYVRCGVLGTGQLIIDDASLTLENPLPAPSLKTNTNLLTDSGFEGDWTTWEIAIPPYAGLFVTPDSTEAHTGRKSAFFEFVPQPNMAPSPVIARVGVAQVVTNRNLGGKRLRYSAWCKVDSLQGVAYLKLFAHGKYGVIQTIASEQMSDTHSWTLTSQELDLPPDTYQVWAWCQYDAPVKGKVHFDDASLEVVGNAPPPAKQPKTKIAKADEKH